MKSGLVYKLNNFYGSSNKSVYRVSDHAVTVSFSWNSELSAFEDSSTPFDEDRFRFHSFEEFQASCDRKGDLYDVVGHMKLVNGQSLIGTPVLDEVEIARARHVLVHLRLEPTCVKLPKSMWILQRGVREVVTLMRWGKLNAPSVGCRASVCRLISCK